MLLDPGLKKKKRKENKTTLHSYASWKHLVIWPLTHGVFPRSRIEQDWNCHAVMGMKIWHGYFICKIWTTMWHLFLFHAFLKTTSVFSFIISLPRSWSFCEITIKNIWSLDIRINIGPFFCAIIHHNGTLEMCFRVNFPFVFLIFKLTALSVSYVSVVLNSVMFSVP